MSAARAGTRDWPAIASALTRYRNQDFAACSRATLRGQLDVLLAVAIELDDFGSHATIRRLLRDDLEVVADQMGMLDTRLTTWLDDDDRAFFSLDLATELERVAGAPYLTKTQRAAWLARSALLKPAPTRSRSTLDVIIPQRRQFFDDGEPIDYARDYDEMVRQFLGFAKVTPTRITCVEHVGTCELTVALGSRRCRAQLRSDADWIDEDAFVACLNQALPDAEKRRFLVVRGPGAGFDHGLVLATPADVKKLHAAGLLLDDDD